MTFCAQLWNEGKINFLGASSGIGAATAVEFAKHGVKVAINGRNAENLEKTAKKCYEAGLRETEVKIVWICVFLIIPTKVH